MGKIYHASNNKCRAEVAILISEKKKQTVRQRLLTEIKNSTKVFIYGQSVRKI